MRHIFIAILVHFSLSSLAATINRRPVDSRDKVKLFPDLIVTTLTEPRYQGGGMYIVNVVLRNIGRVPTPTSTLFFWDIQMQHGQRKQVGPLAARASATISFSLSAPENQGPFYYSAIADYGNAVRELSETNNVSTFRE